MFQFLCSNDNVNSLHLGIDGIGHVEGGDKRRKEAYLL